MKIKLRMTEDQHVSLKAHLYSGKPEKAQAIAICGQRISETARCFMLNDIHLIPHDNTGENLAHSIPDYSLLLDKAAKRNQTILHIFNVNAFSTDALESDRLHKADLTSYYIRPANHANLINLIAIMLPDGHIQAHELSEGGEITRLSLISVVGDDIQSWGHLEVPDKVSNFTESHAQAFGLGTTKAIKQLAIAVVGCSGTGSPVVEQLARLGVGELVLVDPDHIEERNLNRIINSKYEDALLQRPKVEVLSEAVKLMGLDTKVTTFAKNLCSPEVIKAVAECDVIFGCMDGIEGRHLLNTLATFYLIPYFDMGVKLKADGKGGVNEVCGSVHYLQPGKSSLLSRGVYTLEQVRADSIRRTDPDTYEEMLKSKYIVGAQEDSPAVISINMLLASMAVNEFLARLHPYRHEPNSEYAEYRISLTGGFLYNACEGEPCKVLIPHIGHGDVSPLLGKPSLSEMMVSK